MFIADFHIHSKYSRATSRDLVPEILDLWARRKGIGVLGTGDFTHPAWREEMKEKFVSAGEGLYRLKQEYRQEDGVARSAFTPQFIISGEISSIYKKNGKVRKVHNLILLPGIEQAESISRKLETIGNLHSDGRPILGLDSRDLLEIVLDLCPEAIFIPAHIWTPHFSLFGAYSGFDAIEECFGDLTKYIYALETGLSSDPPMNWRLSALDRFTLVSNSDAHSPSKLAREANLFNTEVSYSGILNALKNRSSQEFGGTIEFFPEEGKYHYDGHRKCKICWKPSDTRAAGGICPVCGGRITVGVLHRVEVLADREEGFVPKNAKPFENLIPLNEVIASAMGFTVASKKVKQKYDDLLRSLGSELSILREVSVSDIEQAAGPCIAEGIRRLRCGQVELHPGFDGEYGKIEVMGKQEIKTIAGQLCFLDPIPAENKINSDRSPSLVASMERIPATKEKAGVTKQNEEGSSAHQAAPVHSDLNPVPYGLNEEQWEAVSADAPALAVIAGPGTGKTKTLVCRIAYLIEHCGVHPAQITAVTFTNKAAEEMRSRLEKHFGDKRIAGMMTIGTFHSICLQQLSKTKGEENVTIIDESNALSLIEELLNERKLKLSPRNVLREISRIKNGALVTGEPEIPADLYDAYCAQLQRYGVMDYDDILLEVLRQEPREAVGDASAANSYSYLLIDEFQDINEVQYRLIKKWSSASTAVFIIGDPDQSIYGFRGSDYRYFSRFEADFDGTREIRLVQNYRSTPEIVTSAKSVIAKNGEGERSRSLRAKRVSGSKVRLVENEDEFSEALFVVKEINRILGGIDMLDAHATQGSKDREMPVRGFSDIAVLYRTNRQADILEKCLLKEGIPYTVAGRDDFLAGQFVREALAFFKFLLNPADVVSLLTCLKARKIKAELNQKIRESYLAGGKSVAALKEVLEIMQSLAQPDREHLCDFIELLQKYEMAVTREIPAKLIASWISDNRLSEDRDMDLLYHTSVLHDDMAFFIQNLVLGRESDVVRSGGKVYSPDAVSLMTMHGAKGLEFPVVFLCGVNDGRIPIKNSRWDSDIDEERRLFYVGMTRAKDELILLTSSAAPSPFLAHIAKEHLIRENTGSKHAEFKEVSLF